LFHCSSCASFYKARRDILIGSLEKHLTGIAEWNVPDAGMFVWIDLKDVKDTFELINKKALEEKVILVPGVEFLPNPRDSSHVRASFSFAEEEDIDIAVQRLKTLLIK
jgi:kynurenine/2-aminoadipate aminotransferase